MTTTLQLSESKYTSRVLGSWLDTREGGRERAGINAILPENGTQSSLSVDQLAAALGQSVRTNSGAVVTPETALRVTAVYGCVALIAGAISTLPFNVYERTKDTRKRAMTGDREHEYWWLLNESATDELAACTAMEYFIAARLFYGDAFALLDRPSPFTNRVIGWRPLHPSRVQPFRENGNGPLMYRITDTDGTVKVHSPADVLHVPSLGFDGLRSPSPITYAAREAIGSSLAAEEFSARFFSQGSTHDIALKTKAGLTPADADNLRKSYTAKYGGGSNSRMPLILTGGLEVEKLSITPNDAALLPTRQFTVEEICRVFGVPPYMIGATDKTTSWGSGVEQQGIGFVKYTLRRHLTPIQQEFNRKLWPNRERFFVEHDTKALERGDFKTRMEGYRIAIGRAGEPGWMSPNEVRHEENMEPVTDGDNLNTGIAPGAPVETEAQKATQEATAKAVASAQRTSEQTSTALTTLAAAVQVSANREATPTIVNITQAPVTVNTPAIHNNLPESVVNVEAVMPAPVVNVTAESAPAPVVNIVNEITAQAAPAQVIVNGPDSSESTYQRDDDGEIVKTVTTFKS